MTATSSAKDVLKKCRLRIKIYNAFRRDMNRQVTDSGGVGGNES
jgi:hypothetical protein